jgi:hypothetical protein
MERHQTRLTGCDPSCPNRDPTCPHETSSDRGPSNHRMSPQLAWELANTAQKQRQMTTRRAAIVDFDDFQSAQNSCGIAARKISQKGGLPLSIPPCDRILQEISGENSRQTEFSEPNTLNAV